MTIISHADTDPFAVPESGEMTYLELVEKHGADVLAAAGNLLIQEPYLIGKRQSDGSEEDLLAAIKIVEETGWGLELF